MTKYIANFCGLYSRSTRKGYNELYKPIPLKTNESIRSEVAKFLCKKTLYPALSNIAYGYIIPYLKQIDDIRLSIWIKYYGMDAAYSTIPLKFGPGVKHCKLRLDASNNHICDDWGYHIWDTYLLEKSAESYDRVLVRQLAGCVSRNMQLVKKCDDFSVKLSLDTGTQTNIENVRNCLIEGIFKHLHLSRNATSYINPNGVVFNLKDFRISVCQETQHILIRIGRYGGWKRKCRDYAIVRNSFQQVVNNAHLKWDKHSPPILNHSRPGQFGLNHASHIQTDPYDFYDNHCEYLKHPIFFKEIQRWVLAHWQLNKTTDDELIAELKQKQKSKIFTQKQILTILSTWIESIHPRFQLNWPSVKYILDI